MSEKLGLREQSQEECRRRIFQSLDNIAVGKSITLVTDQNVDVPLNQYQIKRDYRLQWETIAIDGETREVEVTKGKLLDETGLTEFDVRGMPPQRRHEVLLETFDDLDPGEGFVLVNDHDPKPLYHELRSTRGETFEWQYTSRDSQEWKVEIVKTAVSESSDDEVVASFDVREIPKEERHPTIHHRYGNVPDGGTMEIIAPHEPRPLHREFQQQYGQSFTWNVVEDEPGRCRVRITKKEGADGERSPGEKGLEVTRELDVRALPPAQRHERIYDAYDDLEPGEAFVLVNDHDPKPLYHQFDAETGDEFCWEYQQKSPGEFRVRIGKSRAGDNDIGNSRARDSEVEDSGTAPF